MANLGETWRFSGKMLRFAPTLLRLWTGAEGSVVARDILSCSIREMFAIALE